jgi:hypothetical protein
VAACETPVSAEKASTMRKLMIDPGLRTTTPENEPDVHFGR